MHYLEVLAEFNVWDGNGNLVFRRAAKKLRLSVFQVDAISLEGAAIEALEKELCGRLPTGPNGEPPELELVSALQVVGEYGRLYDFGSYREKKGAVMLQKYQVSGGSFKVLDSRGRMLESIKNVNRVIEAQFPEAVIHILLSQLQGKASRKYRQKVKIITTRRPKISPFRDPQIPLFETT